jgi:hypothetical protein
MVENLVLNWSLDAAEYSVLGVEGYRLEAAV